MSSSERPKQSDQMPEEAPAEQVPDDVAEAEEGAARESGRRHAGHAAHGDRSTDRDPRENRHDQGGASS